MLFWVRWGGREESCSLIPSVTSSTNCMSSTFQSIEMDDDDDDDDDDESKSVTSQLIEIPASFGLEMSHRSRFGLVT